MASKKYTFKDFIIDVGAVLFCLSAACPAVLWLIAVTIYHFFIAN